MPSLKQFKYFVALYHTRNFSRAAEQFGVKQPNVSNQIARLENELGIRLFERGVETLPTPAAERILPSAVAAIDAADRFVAIARACGRGFGGRIRLGTPSTVGPCLLAHLTDELRQAHPDLDIVLREEVPYALPDRLSAGEFDLIILPSPVERDGIRVASLYREPIRFVSRRDHPLARGSTVAPSKLAGQQVLVLDARFHLRQIVEVYCRTCGARPMTCCEAASLDALSLMARAGLGVTFLPELYLRKTLAADDTLKVVNLEGAPLERTVGIAWRSTSPHDEGFAALAATIRGALALPGTGVVPLHG